MDRNKIVEVFQEYTSHYNPSDPMIRLKIFHTYRVALFAEQITASAFMQLPERLRQKLFQTFCVIPPETDEALEPVLPWHKKDAGSKDDSRLVKPNESPALPLTPAQSRQLSQTLMDFAYLLGIYHDIGRFEQVRVFGTFIDHQSIDHAELSADLLFLEGLQKRFSDRSALFSKRAAQIAEAAVRLHNKLILPVWLDEETRFFCDILRDADKVDIFRVMTEPPFEKSLNFVWSGKPARDLVMQCVTEHRCVPRKGLAGRTPFEEHISKCCMAFELVFPKSRQMALAQGFLPFLLSLPADHPEMNAQLDILRREVKEVLEKDDE